MSATRGSTPWDQGRLAASNQEPMKSNPYPSETEAHDEWAEGYGSVSSTDEDGELKEDA